jgi:hypothetical protein
VTPGWPISNQAAPTTLTNGCAASVPLASLGAGLFGVDHDAVRHPDRSRVGFPPTGRTLNIGE